MTASARAGDFSSSLGANSAAAEGVNPWIVAVVVSMATFMEVLDTSIANVALPHIAGGLSAGQDESTWVLTSYLVSNAIILPISGWLASVIGRKRFYMSCVALFGISSFLCGIAPSLGALIFFRVLQGIGGGGLAPSEQAILTDTFEPKKRGMAFALYGIAVVVAPAVGPTLGGWITDSYNWRWIFLINIPVAALSLLLTHIVVRDSPKVEAARKKRLAKGIRIDFVGFGLIALGLGTLQVVLDKGQRDDWFGSRFITAFTIISVSCLVLGTIWEFVIRDPIVDVHLLTERTFLISNVAMFMTGFILFGSTVLIPQFLQELMGYTAEKAGLAITPGGFAVMAMMPLVGFLTSHVQGKWIIMFGFALSAVALWHLTTLDLNVSYAVVARDRVFQAAGIAFLFVPINTVAYAGLAPEKSNNASAILNLFRNVGGSVGISLVTTLLARRAQFHQTVLISHLTPYNPRYLAALHHISKLLTEHGSQKSDAARQAQGTLMNSMMRQANMLAYIDSFWVLAVGAACLVPLVFLIRATKPGTGSSGGH